jgi:hypothetical protein
MDIDNGNARLTGGDRIQKSLGGVKQVGRYPPAAQHALKGFAERVVIVDNKYAYYTFFHATQRVNEN